MKLYLLIDDYIYKRAAESISHHLQDGQNRIGSVYGSIITTRRELDQWLSEQGLSYDVDKYFEQLPDSRLFPVAVLSFITVWEPYEGQGYGNKLLSWFLDKVKNKATLVVGVVDVEEQDVDLIAWYKRKGFDVLEESSENLPVVVKRLK